MGKPVRHDPKAATLDSEAKAAFGKKPDAVAAVLEGADEIDSAEMLLQDYFDDVYSSSDPFLGGVSAAAVEIDSDPALCPGQPSEDEDGRQGRRT